MHDVEALALLVCTIMDRLMPSSTYTQSLSVSGLQSGPLQTAKELKVSRGRTLLTTLISRAVNLLETPY